MDALLLCERRRTSMKMGSFAARNAATASSWLACERSVPFTCKYENKKKNLSKHFKRVKYRKLQTKTLKIFQSKQIILDCYLYGNTYSDYITP